MQDSNTPTVSVPEAFLNPAGYDHPVSQIEVVETHISWVFLTGKFAYKVKKPVRFTFLDFSTLEARRLCCQEEIRVNRRLAAQLYIGIVTMGGSPDGYKIGGTPAIEYAVKMRQFDSHMRLDQQLRSKQIAPPQVRSFAKSIARFHAALEPIYTDLEPTASSAGTKAFFRNVDDLNAQLDSAGQERLAAIADAIKQQLGSIETAIEQRRANGFVRECHGDLHLENLVMLEGEIVAFDALEFSKPLRCIDLIDEVCFLTMDFFAHDRKDFGYEFLNAYLHHTGDYTGLYLCNFYMIHRALVRAKVHALRSHQTLTTKAAAEDRYFLLAEQLTNDRPQPLLIITHGLTGSGKTHLSQRLIAELPAITVRSDIERKRIFGLTARAVTHSDISDGIYSPNASQLTYATLEQAASAAIEANINIIVDAAFLRKADRAAFNALAARHKASFRILDCAAPEAVLRDRIKLRRSKHADASEGTDAILDYQLETQENLSAEERAAAIQIDTHKPLNLDLLLRNLREKQQYS